MPAPHPAAISLLEHQQALITRSQLRSLDNGLPLLRRMIRNGTWVRLDAGLYGPAGVPMTWRRRLMAALLLAPAGALASHRSGAHLLGTGGFDLAPMPEIGIPAGTTLRAGGASYRLDLAYPRQRICIEVDGVQHRDDADIRSDDLVRQRSLEHAGWTVIRVRSWCFATDLADALRQLRGHLVDR